MPGVRETVPPAAKVAGSAHVLFEGIESEALLYLLDEAGVCASAASACASGAMEPSHVLAAMGVDRRVGRRRAAADASAARPPTPTSTTRSAPITSAVATLRERTRGGGPATP